MMAVVWDYQYQPTQYLSSLQSYYQQRFGIQPPPQKHHIPNCTLFYFKRRHQSARLQSVFFAEWQLATTLFTAVVKFQAQKKALYGWLVGWSVQPPQATYTTPLNHAEPWQKQSYTHQYNKSTSFFSSVYSWIPTGQANNYTNKSVFIYDIYPMLSGVACCVVLV